MLLLNNYDSLDYFCKELTAFTDGKVRADANNKCLEYYGDIFEMKSAGGQTYIEDLPPKALARLVPRFFSYADNRLCMISKERVSKIVGERLGLDPGILAQRTPLWRLNAAEKEICKITVDDEPRFVCNYTLDYPVEDFGLALTMAIPGTTMSVEERGIVLYISEYEYLVFVSRKGDRTISYDFSLSASGPNTVTTLQRLAWNFPWFRLRDEEIR